MYQKYYGLNDIPFSLAPDPKYLFRTEGLLEVFANLQYGIENGKGIVVVTGEVGTGKTTILRSMLQSLDRSVLAAYIFNPILATDEFFDLLRSELRIRAHPSKAATLRVLGNTLMSRQAQGLRTVLVVDEAHLLPPHLLEEIRLLSNFETNRDKLIQIIMCGQPELHDLLSQPELRQLKQRVSLKCSINPLTASETAEYILWRLRVAGARSDRVFESEAIRLVHRVSGGIPRIINNICDNALLTGFGEAKARITPAIIDEVSRILDLTPISSGHSSEPDDDRIPHFDSSKTERDSKSRPSNVLPIRPETNWSDGHGDPKTARFAIHSEEQDDPLAAVKFFQRVRVKRSAG
jgi:general secretion pathway protein A